MVPWPDDSGSARRRSRALQRALQPLQPLHPLQPAQSLQSLQTSQSLHQLQALSVRRAAGVWVDVEVVAITAGPLQHQLRCEGGGELQLVLHV